MLTLEQIIRAIKMEQALGGRGREFAGGRCIGPPPIEREIDEPSSSEPEDEPDDVAYHRGPTHMGGRIVYEQHEGESIVVEVPAMATKEEVVELVREALKR
jgi:hypothetical protein